MQTNDQVFFEGTNGKAILLIHGITSGAAQMIPMARFLNDYGYSVWCVNLAGHGTYPEDLLHTTCEDMLSKAEYDYLYLKKRYNTVYVGGLSTGGCLSLYLANKYPEIKGIIPISSPLRLMSGTFMTEEYPKEQIYFHRPMDGKVGLFKQYHIHYEDIAVSIFKELGRLMDILCRDGLIEKIECPAIVIQAKDDAVADPTSAPEIFARLSSKNKELYTPDYGEHSIVLTEGRHEAFRRVAMFIEGIE
ncbi:MAG: alpha/beta fold hydrolase [Candidatus Metalachnospira sp.]|nr:alpha/beta fold hydrolase [Candidatus Metalachnospira sp.]